MFEKATPSSRPPKCDKVSRESTASAGMAAEASYYFEAEADNYYSSSKSGT